jgi:hypothetical protein
MEKPFDREHDCSMEIQSFDVSFYSKLYIRTHNFPGSNDKTTESCKTISTFWRSKAIFESEKTSEGGAFKRFCSIQAE